MSPRDGPFSIGFWLMLDELMNGGASTLRSAGAHQQLQSARWDEECHMALKKLQEGGEDNVESFGFGSLVYFSNYDWIFDWFSINWISCVSFAISELDHRFILCDFGTSGMIRNHFKYDACRYTKKSYCLAEK